MLELEALLDRVVARLASVRLRAPTSGELDAVKVQVEELRPLAPTQRALRIRNSPALQSIDVAERILVVAGEDVADDPRRSLGWLAALDVVLDSPALDSPDEVAAAAAELTIRQQAAKADALAKLGEYDAAEHVLRWAREMDARDPLSTAELLEVEGMIAAHRQNLEAALASLRSARGLYRVLGDRHLAARTVSKMSWACGEAGEYARAVELGVEACGELDPARDRRLLLVTLFNLARYLRDAGRLEGALAVLSRARGLFGDQARRMDRLNLEWFEAGVLVDVGRHREAAAAFERVADGFARLGLAVEVGNVAIEAAETFERAGRHELVEQLLEFAVATMRAHGRGRDAAAAFLALQEAARRRAVTAAVLEASRAAIAVAKS